MDGDAIMTDKPAIMALAMLEVAGATGDGRYREAAEAVAYLEGHHARGKVVLTV